MTRNAAIAKHSAESRQRVGGRPSDTAEFPPIVMHADGSFAPARADGTDSASTIKNIAWSALIWRVVSVVAVSVHVVFVTNAVLLAILFIIAQHIGHDLNSMVLN